VAKLLLLKYFPNINLAIVPSRKQEFAEIALKRVTHLEYLTGQATNHIYMPQRTVWLINNETWAKVNVPKLYVTIIMASYQQVSILKVINARNLIFLTILENTHTGHILWVQNSDCIVERCRNQLGRLFLLFELREFNRNQSNNGAFVGVKQIARFYPSFHAKNIDGIVCYYNELLRII
jgi:hypothetical protein